MSNQILVGLALPDPAERETVTRWLTTADMQVESLLEAHGVPADVSGRGFGCVVADGALLEAGFLARLRQQDARTPVVAIVDAAAQNATIYRRARIGVVPRPCDAASLSLAVSLAYGEGRQPRSKARTKTPRVPSKVSGAPAAILDISLDGIRLELSRAHAAKLGPQFRLQVPMVALDVVLRRVWVLSSAGDRVQCGAMLVQPTAAQRLAWERISELSHSTMSLPGMRSGGDAAAAAAADGRLLGRVSQLLTTPITLPGWAAQLTRSRA